LACYLTNKSDAARYKMGVFSRTPCMSALQHAQNTFICRIADLDWQQGRVYFLAFLNPQGDKRSLPLPSGWPVSVTVDEAAMELD
jgi:hypothetical protein